MIRNPILPGFNPDPSLCRVGEDYYIATSTFEWFPGVQIHHSRDLVHWRLRTRPLDRVSQLDLRGVGASDGVWAPCLSHCDGLFHLIYSIVTDRRGGENFSVDNFLVTAPAIEGPWSDPVYLNSSGFDPSLFHDDDGRKWLVNMMYNCQPDETFDRWFDGILLQEYDPRTKQLTGPVRRIFTGTELHLTEGPHLYKIGGWYYLMAAEGGTGYEHAVTVARSRRIEGPYEVDPENPLLTAWDDPANPLQKAGHASLVRTHSDEWYIAHLCGRPLGPERRCILGRETALQKCRWTPEGWLRLEGGGNTPRLETPAPALPPHPFPPEPARDDFDAPVLAAPWQTLRIPASEDWLSLRARPGWLRLVGKKSLGSRFQSSLLARRIQSVRCEASTRMEYAPDSPLQKAGLILYYDSAKFYFLHVGYAEDGGPFLGLTMADRDGVRRLPERVPLPKVVRLRLKAVMDGPALRFLYAADGADWLPLGGEFDATVLSDDYPGEGCFTGAFVGLCAVDNAARARWADFDWFEYRERE